MAFTATTHQNEYLPAGATEVHAIVTVTADEHTQVTASERCIVLIVDDSGSMANPMAKMQHARHAVMESVKALPDGVKFAVIAGNNIARAVYPPRGIDLVEANDRTRYEAWEAAKQIQPSGGTAISTWLAAARQLFDGHPDAIKLAYLLTDGFNEHDQPGAMQAELDRCAGQFQVDARGVGKDWDVAEIRAITDTLLGEVDIITDPAGMQADFAAFLERAIGKAVTDVRLRVWAPKGSTVKYVKQVAPSIADLTSKAEPDGPLSRLVPTGSWAPGESRDYHVAVDVPPGQVGQEKLAARVGLIVDGEQVSQGLVRALWTDDSGLTTRIDPQVAHYTGQAELAEAIAEGLKARKEGDEATATIRLGRAVKIAHESGNEGTVRLLRKVVEVEDPATGTVRLKRKVDQLDEMELDTRSTRTVRTRKA